MLFVPPPRKCFSIRVTKGWLLTVLLSSATLVLTFHFQSNQFLPFSDFHRIDRLRFDVCGTKFRLQTMAISMPHALLGSSSGSNQSKPKCHCINAEITAPVIRLVDKINGTRIISSSEGQREAQAQGLDLVEIDKFATPPVCRIMNYAKFIYAQKKANDQLLLRNKAASAMKEVRFGTRIADHDLDVKCKAIRRFLQKKIKVKVSIYTRGRELSFGTGNAMTVMQTVSTAVASDGVPDKIVCIGNTISCVFTAKKMKLPALGSALGI